MIKFQLLLLFTLTLISISFGQNKIKSSKANKVETQVSKLVGTLRLIEYADLDSSSRRWVYDYGKNTKGYFTYTKSNIVNLNISADTALYISEDSAKNYNVNLLKWLYDYSFGYFGTYSIDFGKSVITHHVTGGSLPWFINTDQRRPFTLKGDTLFIGDNKTWKRVLVKEV